MRYALQIVGIVLGLLVVHAAAGAQERGSDYRPLVVPVRTPLRCDAVDFAGTTTVALALGLDTVPRAPVREIEARYDSHGVARGFTDWGTDSVTQGGQSQVEIAAVWFVGGQALGFHRRESLATIVSDRERLRVQQQSATTSFPPLSAIDQQQARTFAAWLWTHRCHVRRDAR